MAIVVPARMFIDSFKRFNLQSKNLSRCIADGGTVTAPLVPWNTNAVYMSGGLGVSTGEYFFFVFFCLLSPLVSIFLGYTGFTMTPLTDEERAMAQDSDELVEKALKNA